MKDIEIHLGDCITGMPEKLAPDSVDLSVSSWPFSGLFMYSGKPGDLGNNADGTDSRAGQFGLHARFFIEQLFRVMKPGRTAWIHIQQLLRYKNQHGYMGRRDFRGATIDLFCAGGFEYSGEIAIPKNPQAMAQRLLSVSEGILGEVVTIVTRAAVAAVETGKERILPEMLDEMGFMPPSERRHAVV